MSTPTPRTVAWFEAGQSRSDEAVARRRRAAIRLFEHSTDLRRRARDLENVRSRSQKVKVALHPAGMVTDWLSVSVWVVP